MNKSQGGRIETAETFAIDWAKVKNDRLFDGDGKRVDGTLRSIHEHSGSWQVRPDGVMSLLSAS